MHIRSLEIEGFTKHRKTCLTFPRRGLVLVTGPNGAGKSSLPEAVSVALWNKPLRKRTGRKALRMWRNSEGLVKVKTDRVFAQRTAKGKLKWSLANGDSEDFESTSKAQADLEHVVGEHQVWARSRVFSSSDASHFTLAKDSERKRLLELVLRLDVFDGAYKACSKDVGEEKIKLMHLEQEIAVLEERCQGLQDQLDEILPTVPAPVINNDPVSQRTVEAVKARLQKKIAQHRAAKAAARELTKEIEPFVAAKARADAVVERAQEALDAIRGGKCGACGAPLPKDRQEAGRKRLTQARGAQDAAADELREARQTAQAAEQRAETALAGAQEAEGQLAAIERWQAAHDAGRRLRYDLGMRLAREEDKLDTLKADYRAAQGRVAELQAALSALGLAGIRSHMLGAALQGIEAVANAWLARFAEAGDTAITVQLEPYSEKPGGGIKDAISLVLHGVAEPENSDGEGQDYGATSGGERRRVDVAFVLAFAEIEAGASGFDSGTMFFDEVLDGLDEEGREAAFDILSELAEHTCVVVITHNKQLISGLAPHAVAFWQVEGGRVYDRKSGKAAASDDAAGRKPRVDREELSGAVSGADASRDRRRKRRASRRGD